MKNKYYTPTKEEFHIGFEYEYQNMVESGTSVDWFKSTFGINNNLNDIMTSNDWFELPRVKYLDKDDIEDLGFKQLDRVNKRRYNKDNISIWLGDYTQGMLTKIEVRDKLRAVGYTKLFIGDVKNKSELKILLKQLNIQ